MDGVTTSCLTFEAFCEKYDTEVICADALFAARWPKGFRCPECGCSRSYHISTRRLPLFECVSCKRQTSVIAGTVLEGSSTPLPLWFQALYLLSRPGGISSAALSRILSVTYKTAWLISHKLRHAMQEADREETLRGDEVRIQPFRYGSALYPDNLQPLLIGASVDSQDELQAVKIKQPHPDHVDNEERRIEKPGLQAFVREHTQGASCVHFPPISRTLSSISRLKREVCCWLNDTFNGIGAKHLQAYLDEFVFRANRGMRGTAAFASLLDWCANSKTLIYKELIKDRPVLPAPWRAFGSRSRWRGRAMRYFTA